MTTCNDCVKNNCFRHKKVVKSDLKICGNTTICGSLQVGQLICIPDPNQITFITCEDFETNETYLIDTPGKYILTCDIDFAPIDDFVCAIEINSNNVVLDMNCHTLRQINTTDKVSGICVRNPSTSVTILGSNGRIKGFTRYGVRVEGGCKSINVGITPLEISENGSGAGFNGGIWIGNSNFNDLDIGNDPLIFCYDIIVKNVQVVRNYKQGGGLFSSEKVEIENCSFSDTVFASGAIGAIGFISYPYNILILGKPTRIGGIKNLVIKNSHFDNNFTTDGVANGFRGSTFENLVFDHCTFNNNHSITGEVAGTYFDSIKGGVIKNCQFNNNLSENAFCEGCHISGIYLSNGATLQINTGVQIIDCVSSNNTCKPIQNGSDAGCVGFELDFFNGALIKNCLATNNTVFINTGIVISSILLRGFRLQGDIITLNGDVIDAKPRNNVFENCQALNNICNKFDILSSSAIGFQIISGSIQTTKPLENTFKNCVSKGHTVFDTTYIGDGFNITSASPTDVGVNSFINCEAINNTRSGIRFFQNSKNTIKKCNLSNNGSGILLTSSTPTFIVQNCITFNTIANVTGLQVTDFYNQNMEFNNP